MIPGFQRLLLPCALVLLLLVLAWIVFRLGKVRRSLRGVHDLRQADDALRLQAEALLAARLARGEIEQAAYQQLMQRLGDVPSTNPASSHAPEAVAPGATAHLPGN